MLVYQRVNQHIFPKSLVHIKHLQLEGELAMDLMIDRQRAESAIKVMYKKLQIQKAAAAGQSDEIWSEICRTIGILGFWDYDISTMNN